ncbi:Gb:, isoform 2 [Olea europaea subsp. europaea]|uniref:Gb:, isoform 2 n=1 Tax=Olea europaea subsp. europaea TaxID=158383 RepID=A0A8S0T608_OLEEU|nr:Gb:, isoform 2 [Olea europaea subsp. europaea]
MDFFKLKKFRKDRKPNQEVVTEPELHQEEPKKDTGDLLGKSVNADSTNTEIEEDDDDFITNEIKRRLKELRRNSFMVLIPEETAAENEDVQEDEEGETSSCEWRDIEAEGRQFWSWFDAVYDRYCDRILFFDRLSAQQLRELGSQTVSTLSPRLASKKLASSLGCLSLKKFEEPEEESEQLQQPERDPFQDLETAYVAQVCLTWEALHCQYTQLNHKISCQPESSTCYNLSAQQFQQFQVLLQSFIENEPFELGSRPEIYTRTRNSLPKLLQVPKIQGSDEKRKGKRSRILWYLPLI